MKKKKKKKTNTITRFRRRRPPIPLHDLEAQQQYHNTIQKNKSATIKKKKTDTRTRFRRRRRPIPVHDLEEGEQQQYHYTIYKKKKPLQLEPTPTTKQPKDGTRSITFPNKASISHRLALITTLTARPPQLLLTFRFGVSFFLAIAVVLVFIAFVIVIVAHCCAQERNRINQSIKSELHHRKSQGERAIGKVIVFLAMAARQSYPCRKHEQPLFPFNVRVLAQNPTQLLRRRKAKKHSTPISLLPTTSSQPHLLSLPRQCFQ